jgi:plastocyanin
MPPPETMRRHPKHFFIATLVITTASTAIVVARDNGGIGEHTVVQQDNRFDVQTLTITQGDTVSFVNRDVHSHQVFSDSAANSFELGMHPQGQTRRVVFDTPGLVMVECADHPHMAMRVEVQAAR